jgi:predicted Zn-dependent peptidase
MFTSRLNAKLREEKGFTYGIRSHFDARRAPGPFLISASLQADRIGEALNDVRGEIVELLDSRPPTTQELDDARRALIEGQARHFETPSSLVTRYAELVLHGLPVDEHARLADRLSAVTIDSMLAAGRRHIRPDSLVAVVVADARQVGEELSRHAWCDVERAD